MAPVVMVSAAGLLFIGIQTKNLHLYVAIVCFVLTSLILAAGAWLASRALTVSGAGIFVLGVGLLLTALVMEFLEMRVGLKTIGIEMEAGLRAPGQEARSA